MKFTFGIITKSQNSFGRNDPSSPDKGNILKVIQSIEDLNIPEYEIIIVDDNSPDETWKVAQNLERKINEVKLIIRKKEKGIGRI